MSTREAFEKWFAQYHACTQYGGIDCTNPKGIAEDAWQASRAAALHEVVDHCDDVIGKAQRAGLVQHADCAANIAVAIRALAKAEGEN